MDENSITDITSSIIKDEDSDIKREESKNESDDIN